jgi:3-hydroxyisobutyrate dehydrogenase-like beta-hydroxyacid dehydrogenase
MNLLCAEDNEKTRLAAAGALAIMCSGSEKICKRIRNCCKSWLQNLR